MIITIEEIVPNPEKKERKKEKSNETLYACITLIK